MFRLWGKMIASNRILKDEVVELASNDTRTHLVFAALEQLCYDWDLEKPIWLDNNIREFQRSSHTRFTPDSFIEAVDFDYIEIRILEEELW